MGLFCSPCTERYSKIKETRAVRKLACNIGIWFVAYITLLQIFELVHSYIYPTMLIESSLSSDPVPLPAITVCFDYKLVGKKEMLQQYSMDSLSLQDDGWKKFPWKNKNFTQFFHSAVMFPAESLEECQIMHSPCEDTGGFTWKNFLLSDRSCSTFMFNITSKKLNRNRINMNWPRTFFIHNSEVFNTYIHEKEVSIPKYTDTSTIAQEKGQSYQYISCNYIEIMFEVEKKTFLDTVDKDSCQTDADYDPNKELDKCIETSLISEEYCILPWMSVPGRQCKNLGEARNMMKKISELKGTKCRPGSRCIKYIYKTTATRATPGSYPQVVIELHVYNDIPVQQQKFITSPFEIIFGSRLLSSILQLLADVGGLLGIVWNVSLLWLLQSFVGGIIDLLYICFVKQSTSQKTELGRAYAFHSSVKAAANSLLSAFSIIFVGLMGYTLTVFLWRDIKQIIFESGNNAHYKLPYISLCSTEINATFALKYEQNQEELPQNYLQIMHKDFLTNMKSCHINDVPCSDLGVSFTKQALGDITCQIMDISKVNIESDPVLELVFNYYYPNRIFLQDSPLLPFYINSRSNSFLSVANRYHQEFSYAVTQYKRLPECNDQYSKCLEDCYDTVLLKYWNPNDCYPKPLRKTVEGLRQCTDFASFFHSSVASRIELFFNENSCTCGLPCLQTFYKLWHHREEEVYTLEPVFRIGLKAEMVDGEREELTYSLTKFLMQFGGLFGVIVGASIYPLFDVLSKTICGLRSNIITRTLHNIVSNVLLFGMWGFVIYESFLALITYGQFKAATYHYFETDNTLLIPDISVCLATNTRISPHLIRGWGMHLLDVDYEMCSTTDCVTASENMKHHVPEYMRKFHLFDITKNLLKCSVWGYSCMNATGRFHSWKIERDINGYCGTLEIQPLVGKYHVNNQVSFELDTNFALFLKSKHQTLSEYDLHSMVDIVTTFQEYRVPVTKLQLIHGSLNKCNENKAYSKDKCLKSCITNEGISKLNCTLPWITSIRNVKRCQKLESLLAQVVKMRDLNTKLGNKCGCLDSCNSVVFSLEILASDGQSDNAGAKLYFSHESLVIKNTLSYTTMNLWVDIGGLLTLLIGKNIWDFGKYLDGLYME